MSNYKDIYYTFYKDIYYTLFERHLSYGIAVWGGLSNSKLRPLFRKKKLFGDKVA